MKKFIIITLIFALSGGGYYFYKYLKNIPRSPEIILQLKQLLNSTNRPRYLTDEFYRLYKDQEREYLYMRLVDAYIDEKKYDHAIYILRDELQEHDRKEKYFHKKTAKAYFYYAQEAVWYSKLILIYTIKGDFKSVEDTKKSRELSEKLYRSAPIN